MKACTKCGEIKDISLFKTDKKGKDGKAAQCKECNKKYRLANKDQISEYNKKYYYADQEKAVNRVREYYFANHEERKQANSERKKRKRAYYTSKQMEREARKINATPSWVTQEDKKTIEAKYAMAKWLSEVVGVLYHVDHIIPLRGKNVSGLHVPDNLRIITAEENMRKGNRHG